MPVLLCIDIGNTNTVFATFEGDKLYIRGGSRRIGVPPQTNLG